MKKVLVIVLMFFCFQSFAQSAEDVDIIQLIRELQITKKENNHMQLVWWLPNAYWDIALKQTNTVSAEVAETIKEIVKDYSFFCIADMTVTGTSGFAYKDAKDIANNLSLIDSSNKKYSPLDDSEIPMDLLRVRDYLKPFLAKTMGQVGSGITICLFKTLDEKGKNMFNPYKAQKFTIKLYDQSFNWELPLPALLPPRFCPVDNEPMKGNWEYCPIHGAKLKH
jgi:hypothetical protein